jgi:hypothetical protein
MTEINGDIKSNKNRPKFKLCPSKALYRIGFSSRKGVSETRFKYYQTYMEGLEQLNIIMLPTIFFDVRKVKDTHSKKYFIPITNDFYFLERVYRDKKNRIRDSQIRNKVIVYREEKFLKLSDKRRYIFIEIVDWLKNINVENVYIKKMNNKIIFDGDVFDCIVCKDVEDCQRLYNMLKNELRKLDKLFFLGNEKKPTPILKRLSSEFGVGLSNLMFVKRLKN